MERDVAGTFSLVRDDKMSTPRAVAVIDDGTVVVDVLKTPYRYYVVPAFTGFVGISASELVAARLGSGGFLWGLAGAVAGVFLGMFAALALQNRKHDATMRSIADGEREPSTDIVVKKGKVSRVEMEEDGIRKSLHIVTPKHDLKLSGGASQVERVHDALT